MFMDVDGVGNCEVIKDVWFTLPDWKNKNTVCVGIVTYINEFYEKKQVIGVCSGKSVSDDIKMVIAGGVPCNVAQY